MLYNHKQFRKNSDKKIMRKVKKNWVVLSVASFSLIGAAAVMQSNQNVAFASETQVSSNSTTNQNNNNSTIDNQKNEAKAQLDAEASKIKDAINNDASLSQSDKDSQNAEVDSYKVAGEQSIDGATDADSINQALSDGKNNIDASHVAGQSSTDSNASSNASSSADQSNQSSSNSQSQQSSASSSTSSDDSLTSSSFRSDNSNSGLSLRDGSSDVPQDSDTYISGPKKDYPDATANTKLKYTGVTYDYTTGNYVINFQFGSKVITKTGGANRVLEFAINTSPNLSSKVNQVTVTNTDGTRMLTNNNGQYYIKYSTGKVVGGNIDIAVYVNPVKVTPGDWISAFMSTHREHSDGSLWNSSTEIAFSSTRSLTYNQFGNDFNSQLLSQLRLNELNDLNQTSPLNQATQLLNNYTSQINALTTDDDFVSQLNAIQSAYRADNTSIANAMTQLQNQKATSTNNVSNLSNLSASDKQSSNNSISTAFQTAQANLLGVSQSNQIAGVLSYGINSIKKAELQATINSAISDINNAVTNTTNKIQSDRTIAKDQFDQQLQNVKSDKANYTIQLQNVTDIANVAGIRDQGVKQINSEYVSGPSIPNQKSAAQAAVEAEFKKINNTINADNTLTSDEKEQEISKLVRARVEALSSLQGSFSADAINDARDKGIQNIDVQYAPSSTSLDSRRQIAKNALDNEAGWVKSQIDGDNTLTSAEKTQQKNNLANALADLKSQIDASNVADDIINLNTKGVQIIDGKYIPGKTSLPDQKANAKAKLEAEATKIKNQIDADNTLTISEKTTQKNNVDNVKANDQGNIDAATNADGVNNAYSQGVTDIDNQYSPGKTSLPDQKANAKAKLEAEATKVKGQIDADNRLTSTDKNAQKANVDSVKATDQAKIDATTNADDIISAYNKGVTDIDNQYVPGKTSVADQQSNANAKLEAEATKVKCQIDADNTLTTAEKNTQKANVESTKAVAQAAVNAATNADDINTAYNKGITDIDKQYVPGKTSLADQKTNAKANLDAQADKIKNDIANDATLTQDQKNAQLAQLQTDKTAAEQAIENAQNADAINQAISGGNTKMAHDHQSGDSIDSQKAAAKQAIQDEANKVKAAIDADTSLTGAEKDQQKNAVNSVAKADQANIDGLTNADDINTAKKRGIADVDGKHVSGTPLDTQKSTAKSQITNEANKIKQDIANDSTLTQAQKDAQTAKVQADADAASKAIDNASDADSVNKAISDGKTNIDADHVSKASVDSQKSDALNQLDAQAAKVKQDIANDATLTQDEKDAQTAKVDADAAAGKQAIQNATDADSINKALSDNSGQIAGDHQPGSSVDNQKDSNNANLDAEATKVKNQIDADVSLTGKEKDQQKSNVDSVKEAAEAKIKAATNADGIKSAYDQGIKDIDAQYVPGKTSLPDQKANAKAQLDAQAAKMKQDIANDPTLTQIEKNEQSAMVDADKDSAETAIDNAKDADAVNQAISDGNQKITSDHKPGKSINEQKADAKSSIQAEATKIKSEIDSDPTLTSDEKAAQKNKVDSVSSAEQAKIDGLTNVDDIHNQITQSVKNIDDVHQSGNSLDDQKSAAKSQLDAQAAKIKQDIANDETLTQADKDAQSAKVDADVKSGNDAIDKATDADSINGLIKDNKDKIAADHVSHASVDEQKASNKKTLDDQAAKVKQDIANDNTLTQAEKNVQTAKVDADRQAAEKAIDAASDAEGIKKAIDAGNKQINADHVPGKSVDDQKSAAKKTLDDQAAKIKQDIANDATLTQNEKDAQSAKVDADRDAGEKAIDGATNADDINKLISDTTGKINSDHVSGQSVADQKTSKKNDLDNEANKIKGQIDADNTLTQAEKDAQKAAIDADVKAGKKAIDAANDAEGIKQAADSSKQKIDGEHKSDKSVADQKNDAKSQVDAEANKIKAAIDADDTLTGAEKAQQKKNVDDANKAAQAKIDAATNADEINNAIKDGNTKIDDQHKQGTSVKDQQAAAKKQLDAEADKIKQDIDNDLTLSKSAKDAQKAKIENDVQAGKDAIDKQSNADDINQATADAKKAIDGEHVSGTPLSEQRQTAQDQLNAQAAKIKQDIQNDATLTSDQKKDQIAKVNLDVEGGKNAINSATDADGINDALSGANNKVGNDHKPAASVSDQKSNASSQLDAEAKQIKDEIQNDATLTSDQKKAQSDKIDADVAAGKQAIENATDADSINKALSDANKAIDADYKPGTSLDTQKSDAKNAIDAEADKIKGEIDADNTLTNDEKKAQKAKVDSDAQAGKDSIENASDADSINKLVSDTNDKVDKDHAKSTVSLQDQKSNAKKQLEDLAAKTKQDIANDATLTQSEKDAQTAQVESDKTAAEKAIDNASDAEDIKEATDNGNKQINADHNSGDSVDTQKQSVNNKLDAEANEIKNQIDADNTLTSSEKDQQKKNVDQANQDAKDKIKAASNADEINDIVSKNTGEDGIIDKQHNSGKSVKDQQDAAKSQLDAEANNVKAAIDADNTLTGAEKAQQKNNVDDANKAAQAKIDASTNADEINDLILKNTGKDGIIDKEHVPGKSVDDQKSAAKQKLEAQAAKVKNDIANDATLTKEQRDAQVAKVDTDKTAAENAVDASTDADSINKAINDGNDKISKDHVPGKSLNDQKENANAQLDAEAKKIKSEIDNDNSLTSVEKDVQKAKVDADVKSGKEAIDNATEADNINKAVSDTNAQVDKDHVSGASVDSQKDAAKQQLDAQAAKTKQDITNDDTLTQAEKDDQIAKVEADKTAGEKAIDDAKDADSINQALVNSNKQIGADHVPGNSLNDQKDAAKKQLDAESDKTKATIDADKTLTSAEKAQQKANVDAKNKVAQDNVDAQTNADNINAMTAQGVEEIDAQYVPGKVSLSDQKTNAKAQLEEEAAKVKNDIANDATLTQDQKNTQMAQVDADKEAGEQAIDNATDADGINQAVSDTNAKIDSDHVSGQSVDDQKTAAKDTINTEANKVKAEIDADKTLSKAEKQRQKNNVDRALAAAQSVIDGLTNADDINSAIAEQIHIIDLQHVKKQNNGSGPNQVIPRNVYMIKNFYRYLSTNFTKKNRVEGYKATSRPNAVMFRIIGETTNKNGVKRYKVYQIVIKKNGLFKVDRKKWGYITARPSYMRPLYYSSNVHTIKVIGKRVRAYKNVKLKNAVNAYKQGTVLKVKAVKKFGSAYRLQLTNGTYISANKNLVKKESTPRDIYMVKGFYRYSSVNFSHKNRIEGYKKQSRPNAVMFRVAGEYTNKRGLKRYKVYQIVRNKKGLFRVDYKKWGYVTAKPSFVKPLYYSSNVQKVKVIGNRIRSYRKPNLSKAVSSYKHATVLKVKAVKKLGTAYRLQLSNGTYISANKNLVQVIK
ncbi:DUF1542 domain-containing protein [Apilactobacillus kunkeei]|nr:DUF1542 domain-containing protein [Apilactobacillus kunkeei]TMT04078.1 DUF1542 domain-containing protein [Apilactobacillus kunkeei]